MPIYEYECVSCGDNFEKRQSFSDEPKADCPTCESTDTRRLISSPAIVFKGSGFYVTDHKNGTNGISKNGKSVEKTSEVKSPENKSESKTESKSETKSSDD